MKKRSEAKDLLRTYFDIMGPSVISADGVVDVQGNVELLGKRKFTQLPVRFGTVSGNFSVVGQGLTTLAGCPTHVGGTFKCMINQLMSLAHGPQQVGGSYLCGNNQLTSLAHAPTHVPQVFNCAGNQLTNLQHAPVEVGDFSCQRNPLSSLDGAPAHVEGTWTLSYDEHLPMLRCLVARNLVFVNQSPTSDQVFHIMKPFMGQGKQAAIVCAVALIKAGYKGNARW